MTLYDIESALRALARDPKGIVNRPHAHTLCGALAAPWMDAALAARITAALSPAGRDARWEPPPLRVGETWLLLCDVARGHGRALRWRSLAERSSSTLTQECEDALDRSWRGLLATLAARLRGLPNDMARGGFEIPALEHEATVEGASLGVAACFAWVSRALNVAPPAHLAASAAVGSDGALRKVEMLGAKLTALRASAPHVTHVVVAREQPTVGSLPDGLELVPCATLAEALEHAAFDLDALPDLSVEDLAAKVSVFAAENSRAHGRERWRALSDEAWAVAQGLAGDPVEQAKAAEARVWAALFALHAGDDVAARDIIDTIEAPREPRVRLWKTVVGAATKIDRDRCDEALADLDACDGDVALLSEEYRWIEGHARGTRGRALLHGGRLEEARRALEETVHWFVAREMPWEAARTSKDLATSLRLMQRPEEALEAVDRALAWLDTSARRRAVSGKTGDFLRLERGRCLLALDRPQEAHDAFERVRDAQERDTDYPRLGAVRGLLAACRRTGRSGEAVAYLARCRDAALSLPAGSALGRVAAVAAAEALVDGDRAQYDDLRGAWQRHFPEAVDDDAVRAQLARQVY